MTDETDNTELGPIQTEPFSDVEFIAAEGCTIVAPKGLCWLCEQLGADALMADEDGNLFGLFPRGDGSWEWRDVAAPVQCASVKSIK